jgi:hypothetical protein
VVFLSLSVAAVPFHWVGYDSLTLVLLAGVFLAARRDAMVFFLGVLGGMQHAELFVACSVLGLVYLSMSDGRGLPEWVRRRTMVLAVIGGIAGRLVLEVLFRVRGIEVSSRLNEAVDNLTETPAQLVRVFLLVVVSGLGVGWIALVFGWWRRHVALAATLGSLLLALTMSVVALDQTRVFALSSLYVVLFAVVLNRDFVASLSTRIVGALALAFLLYPGIWVWEGEISWYANFRGVSQVVELFS